MDEAKRVQAGKTENLPGNNTLRIYTLGRFQIRFGDRMLVDATGRFKKIGELLMYLITHRGKHSTPETILETIWPDHDYTNPRNVFKNMIYRLKQDLEQMQIPEAKALISYSYGAYGWNINAQYWLDADVFESLCQEARSLSKIDPFLAAEKYREALTLYLGHYLPECQPCSWVMTKRHYYRRLFVRSVSDLLAFQKEHRLFSQMAEDCERALSIEDFDEKIHLFYMEALLEEGKTAQAKTHYEYITSLNYHEHGEKPSPAMQRIYKAIKSNSAKAELDYTDLRQMLVERDEAQGALFCEPATFRLFCRLERRRAERENRPVHVGLLSLTGPTFHTAPSKQLQQSMECLREVLTKSLRRADMISPWNDTQFAVLLPGLNLEQAENLLQRVREKFKEARLVEDLVLRSSVHSFLPPEYSLPQD